MNMSKPVPIAGPAALLAGTMVGAGVFALPAAAAASGLPIMLLWAGLLAAVMLLLHLMFAEVVLRTKEAHRMPGYVGEYLGSRAKYVSLVTTVIGSSGALLIYLVLFEKFSTALLPVSGIAASIIAWTLLSMLVVLGIKTIARVEFVMTILLMGVMVYLITVATPHIAVENLFSTGDDPFLPFGVLLFAMGGFSAIPEMHTFFLRGGKQFAKAITIGLLGVVAVYIIFSAVFVGAFGSAIGGELTDAVETLGKLPLIALALFGIMAISTSFLVLGSYLVHTLQFDLRIPKKWAPVVLVLPLLFYIGGARNFVDLVAFIGAIFIGVDAFFILWTWRKARKMTDTPTFSVSAPEWIVYPLVLLFGSGVVAVLWRSIV